MKPTNPVFSFEPFVHSEPDYLKKRLGFESAEQKRAEEAIERKRAETKKEAEFWNPVLKRISDTLAKRRTDYTNHSPECIAEHEATVNPGGKYNTLSDLPLTREQILKYHEYLGWQIPLPPLCDQALAALDLRIALVSAKNAWEIRNAEAWEERTRAEKAERKLASTETMLRARIQEINELNRELAKLKGKS